MTDDREPLGHVQRNRARWDVEAKNYVAGGERSWAREEPAWGVWRVNYLMQLLGVRNRGTLLVEWILSFFAGRLVANTP